MEDLTWACHVCGQIRPDSKISVYSTKHKIEGLEFIQNVRYCNDNPDCIEGAKEVDWFGRTEASSETRSDTAEQRQDSLGHRWLRKITRRS